MFVYEIIPSYIFPLLNGINIFCLASQKASPRTVDIFTNLFGGTNGNEGLGLFSISFDWQYIGSVWDSIFSTFFLFKPFLSSYMSLPLIQQGN